MEQKAKYVQVQVSMILHFKDEMSTLPMDQPIAGTCETLRKFMNSKIRPKAVGFSDGHVSYSLLHLPMVHAHDFEGDVVEVAERNNKSAIRPKKKRKHDGRFTSRGKSKVRAR